MGKIMPLDLLSSIKGARSSEAVNELFNVIKKAVPDKVGDNAFEADMNDVVSIESLRSDKIQKCPETEKELIKKNFPKEKNGFLVVPKVIED
jgi:Asp-tRNA(Asn)/Glu-tRNA(Gln) amidotransferase C subunit